MKYVLSSHYQGTEYDCYGNKGTHATRNAYRPIGINRNSQLAVLQIRPYVPEPLQCIQWMAFGSNAFNSLSRCTRTSTRCPRTCPTPPSA